MGPGGTLPEPRPLPLCFPRPEKYDDHWRYDPRFTGSFDDEPEPHRDPYGEEVDRRSEHSARSLHSSFSSHSHQVGGRAGAGPGPRVLVAAWGPAAGVAKRLHLFALCSLRVRCTEVAT